jgi:hypothetical protein
MARSVSGGAPPPSRGTRRSFLKLLRRKHLRDPPLERRSLCTPSSQKPRARHEPARTGRGPSPAMCGGVTGQISRSRGNGLGAALGATGTNDFGYLRTYANSEHGPIPRSRTVLNGSGRPHWNLRIRRLGVRVPPSAPGLTRRDASSRAVRTVPAEPGIARNCTQGSRNRSRCPVSPCPHTPIGPSRACAPTLRRSLAPSTSSKVRKHSSGAAHPAQGVNCSPRLRWPDTTDGQRNSLPPMC